MNEQYLHKIGYANKEFARIDWYDDNAEQVHHTFCYDEEEVEANYYNHLSPASPYAKWHPKVVLIGEPAQYKVVNVCHRAS